MSSGGYGTFKKLNNKTGFKYLHNSKFFNTIKEANTNTQCFISLMEEFLTQKAAHEKLPKVICKPIGISLFKIEENVYVWGLEMEYLGKKTLRKTHNNYDVRNKIISKFIRLLSNNGILHDDIHANNIMNHKGRYKVIDFGCANIERFD